MRRYPFVLGATVAGLAGLLTFHSSPASPTPSSSSTTPATGTSASPPTTTAPSGSTPPSTSAPTTTSPTTSAPTTTKSATGTLEQFGYGQLSVRVTMSGGKVTKVTVATLQVAEQYSQQLSDQAVPPLEREVLDAQSATISGVSGATYTSQAYALSVQSALDKLRK